MFPLCSVECYGKVCRSQQQQLEENLQGLTVLAHWERWVHQYWRLSTKALSQMYVKHQDI